MRNSVYCPSLKSKNGDRNETTSMFGKYDGPISGIVERMSYERRRY